MTNYGSLYKTYENKFYNARKQAKDRRLPMAWDQKMSKEEFIRYFEAQKTTLVEGGRANPTNTEIVKAIVDRQQYGASEAQGRALQSAMAARGYDVSLAVARAYQGYLVDGMEAFEELPASIRKGGKQVVAFYEEIKQFYWEQRALGLNGAAIKHLISQVYFGSP